jgi:DNA-directed RNA polymerase alpha subunit
MDQGSWNLELSVRSVNMAKRVGATTVGELVLFTEDEILSARCFGETALREIREQLARRGLRLGMAPAELRGHPDTRARIVVSSQVGTAPPPHPEEEGACCGHCADAARKLLERGLAAGVDHELERKLNLSLAELELSVRATNVLEAEGLTTVRDLVNRTAEELAEIRDFRPATLREVTAKLAERGLRLGMGSAVPGGR